MFNKGQLAGLMKQAQAMQDNLKKAQDELATIEVTGESGARISWLRANARYWSKAISFLMLGIGFLMVAFTARRQALHDMVAGTLVVSRRPPS